MRRNGLMVGGLALCSVLACSGDSQSDVTDDAGSPATPPPVTAVTEPNQSMPADDGSEGARFPVAVSSSRDHLVDGSGAPWMMFGDSAWSLVGELDQPQTEAYLDDRRAKGFNLVLVSLLEATFSSDPPNNAAGAAPFTGVAFQSAINDDYFAHADEMIRAAAERGITVLLCPGYLGFDDSEGWGAEIREASDEQLAAYGATIGARYASAPNIIWLMGGDRTFDASDESAAMLARTDALARGIRSMDSVHLMTFHTGPDQRAAEVVGDEDWLDLNNVYSYARAPVEVTRAALDDEPQRPIFWMEGHYENNPDVESELIRAQAWGSILAGALAGHVFGNDPIWHFGSGGVFDDLPIEWEDAVDGRGSVDMSHLIALITRLEWSTLRSDTDGAFLSGPDSAVGSYSADLGVIYAPTEGALTVDFSVFEPAEMRARWYDPTSGEFTPAGDFDTGTTHDVPHPGDNSQGESDWVLVVDVP